MLGRRGRKGELFRTDHVYRDRVGKESFRTWLGAVGPRTFEDESFAGLYRKDGRPCAPPSQLRDAFLLQTHDGVSDEEAVQRGAVDLRWKVVLRLSLEEELCVKSTLRPFRAKLVPHEEYQRLFKSRVSGYRDAGLLKRRKPELAIDATPVFGRGAIHSGGKGCGSAGGRCWNGARADETGAPQLHAGAGTFRARSPKSTL